jgi:glyoxylase-like metal-dependent hydrolase (beta-lactamase superfamily II)
MVMISALISHPTEGLVLFETGAGKDYPEVWGPQLNDIFARDDYIEDQELDAAIRKTGNDIKDIKAVIMGHLHLDHAGGLEYFRGTDVPIYTHELELKNAFYSVATKTDLGEYISLLKTSRSADIRLFRRVYANVPPVRPQLEAFPWRCF